MSITLNLTENDAYITDYITKNNIDTSNMNLDEFLELLENIEDLKALEKAQAEDDGYRISFEDLMKKYEYEL